MCLCWRAVGGTVGGAAVVVVVVVVVGVRHIQTGPEKRPNVRISVLSWLAGELREGGELVLETAREGGTSSGLPSI